MANAMRAYDGYSERQLRDGSPDKIASKHMLGEVSQSQMDGLTLAVLAIARDDSGLIDGKKVPHLELTEKEREEQEMKGVSRDQIALASIMFGSPLMLFGMGATFAAYDECHAVNAAQNKLSGMNGRRYIQAGKKFGHEKKAAAEIRTLSGKASLSMPVEGTAASAQSRKKADERFETMVRGEKQQAGAGARGEPLPRKAVDVIKASKLMKEKSFLTDQLEKMRGHESLSVVSSIVSRIEVLDKTLKRMGS